MEGFALTEAASGAAPRPDRTGDPGRWLGQRAFAPAVAALVGAVLLLCAIEEPLPAFGWAAAFLTLAVERDLRSRRIPNWLTLPALAFVVVRGAWLGGTPGLTTALLGAGAALALLFVPFVLRGLGAGDVKALMVLGGLWGASTLMPVLAWSVLFGGVLALLRLAVFGALPDFAVRLGRTFSVGLATRRFSYAAPEPGSPASQGIPFAVAIALGVAATTLLGAPWV